VGYENKDNMPKKVTIEFIVGNGEKEFVIDYLGPYTIKANSKLFIAQQYMLSKKLAAEKGLKITLKMFEKGKVIEEIETAF